MNQPPIEEKQSVAGEQSSPDAPANKSPHPRRRRKILFISVLILFFLLLGGVLLEVGLRIFHPYLMPQKLEYTKDLGLPRVAFEAKWNQFINGPYDYVAIGDSYVATASTPVGWIPRLEKMTGKRIMEFGFQGACPSQYFALYDRIRREGITTPVLIVIYLGNDLMDEAIYAHEGADKSHYFDARYEKLSNPKRPYFWPGCELPPWSWLSNHLATYRAGVLGWSSLKGKFYKPTLTPSPIPGWHEDEMRKLANQQCNKQPWAEWVGGRLYFFRSHNAVTDPEQSAEVRQGQERILDLLRRHRLEPGLTIFAALGQEETSEAVHGRKVAHAAPFIQKMKETGANVVDGNAGFFKKTKDKNLYYGDGHWNSDGHAVFAEEVKKALGL